MLHSLHIDMNSFFASCEQQVHPELRGRPVGVIAVDTEYTSCLAASIEAKRFGVKTGTGVLEARQKCPDIVFRLTTTGLYGRMHYAVREAVDSVWPVHKTWSIDEIECVLTGKQRERAEAEALAKRIKQAIREQVGACLTCSIGIAPNQLLAKLATELQKPDGLVIIEKHELPQRLYPVKLNDLVGIGPAMERRLLARGITSFEQLCALTEQQMRDIWKSVDGVKMYRALRGEQYASRREVTRSIGHQHVLPPEKRAPEQAWGVLVKLMTKAAERARAGGFVAGKMVCWARIETQEHVGERWEVEPGGEGQKRRSWSGKAGWEVVRVLEPPTNDTLSLTRMLPSREEWMAMTKGEKLRRLRMVGVTLLELEPEGSMTLPLFVENKPRDKAGKAMDTINEKFGRDMIYPASMQGNRSSAPRHIAFKSIPQPAELKQWEKASAKVTSERVAYVANGMKKPGDVRGGGGGKG